MKKRLLILVMILCCLMTTGCWSYIGVDEITIVTGLAIDKDEKENYKLTFEVINLSKSNKQTGIKVELVQSTGETIFDAIRNARTTASDKLYFSHAQVIIVSREIAEKEGINEILNFFIRDEEIRETNKFAISDEKTAASLLNTKGITNSIVAFEIMDIIEGIETVNLASTEVQLFEIVNILEGEGMELVLPVFDIVTVDNEKQVHLKGTATFKDDKLYDILSAEQSKYLLFVLDKVEGGLLNLSSKDDEKVDITIEIYKSKTEIDYEYDEDKIKIFIDINVDCFLGEYRDQRVPIDSKWVKKVEKQTAEFLKDKIEETVKQLQEDGNYDVFRFGNKIYKKNPKLWKKLKKEWNQTFATVEIEVRPKVNIKNTAFVK